MHALYAIGAWAIIGLIMGAIARLIVPGRQQMNALMTILLGAAGSIVGGLLSWLVAGGPEEPYHSAGFIGSVVGAAVVVWIYATSANRRDT